MEKPKPVSGPPSSSETAAAHPSPNEIAGAVASALREKALAKLERARPYQAPTKPSMKRRCDYNDYTAPKIYMVTLVVEGRRPLFGTLSGDPHIPYATQGGARLSLTALGKTVKRLWYSIPQYHPQVRVEALQLMPDHLHGILRITEGGQLHLGDIVRGFKTGCNKAYRQLHPAPDDAGGPSTAPPLFERGYNDRILYGYGKLQTWLRYLAENPRRLLIKRSHRDFFHIHRNVCFNGLTLSTVGNTLLLHHPVRLQVRCHRNETPEAIERLIRHAQGHGRAVARHHCQGQRLQRLLQTLRARLLRQRSGPPAHRIAGRAPQRADSLQPQQVPGTQRNGPTALSGQPSAFPRSPLLPSKSCALTFPKAPF